VPDVYAGITEADPAAVAQIAAALELSAGEPQQRAMLAAYVDELALAPDSAVLEVGCGTGAIARTLADRPEVASVVGLDPSAALLERARELAASRSNVTFREGDGAALPFADATFDAVVLHRVLAHVPEPERVLAEAARVLRPGGGLAIFDGDYATITVATGEADPLQACVAAFAPAYVHDPWVVRRLLALVRATGLEPGPLRSHGYAEVDDPDYLLTITYRGADALVACGRIGAELGEALKAEARRRVEEHAFFGHIAYASLVARRP
jgi:arsenite methyltransferase